jgi:hypothetical protein
MKPPEDDMDTIAFEDRPEEEGWDAGGVQGAEDRSGAAPPRAGSSLPGRPHRRFLNRYTATMLAVLTAAGGFYAGVRVEKSHVNSGGSSGLSSLASRFAALGGGARSGAATGATAGGSGAASRGAAGALASRFGAGGAGGASFGTVSSIRGKTLYVTESSGDVVEVRLSSATKLTKSESVSSRALHPGDTVVVQGAKQSNGSVVATSVSDSGTGGAFGGGGLGALLGGGGGGAAGSAGAKGSSGQSGGGLSSLFSNGG